MMKKEKTSFEKIDQIIREVCNIGDPKKKKKGKHSKKIETYIDMFEDENQLKHPKDQI